MRYIVALAALAATLGLASPASALSGKAYERCVQSEYASAIRTTGYKNDVEEVGRATANLFWRTYAEVVCESR